MFMKIYCIFCGFIIISIVLNQTVEASDHGDHDLVIAGTVAAKKAITSVTTKAGQKGAVIAGSKKLAKGAALAKTIGTKKTAIKSGKIAKLGAFKKTGIKKGYVAKSGIKKTGAKNIGFDKSFAIGSKSLYGKMASFGKKSKFAVGRSKGVIKSVGSLTGGVKKKSGAVVGINAGVKKIIKKGKLGLAAGKIGVVGKKAGAIGLEKGTVVAGQAGNVITGKGFKG